MADIDYILGPWQWSDDVMGGSWNPPENTVGLFDLGSLPMCGSVSGTQRSLGLFCLPRGSAFPSEYDLLASGDCREIAFSAEHSALIDGVIRDHFGSGIALAEFHGLPLSEAFVCGIMAGDPSGNERWKPGTYNTHRELELHLGGHSRVFRRQLGAWNPAQNRWHNAVRDLIRRDMREITKRLRDEEQTLRKLARELRKQGHDQAAARLEDIAETLKDDKKARQYLRAQAAKYGCSETEFSDLEPLAPDTVISESWPTTGAITAGQDNAWSNPTNGTWFSGVAAIYGQLYSTEAVNWSMGLCLPVLSSDDHTAKDQCSQIGTYASAVLTRMSPGNGYHWDARAGTSYHGKWIATAFTTLQAYATGFSSGDTKKLASDGSSHRVYRNDLQVGSTQTDTSLSGILRCGVGIIGNGARSDNWVAQDILSAYDLLADAISHGHTIDAPTLSQLHALLCDDLTHGHSIDECTLSAFANIPGAEWAVKDERLHWESKPGRAHWETPKDRVGWDSIET